MIKLNYIYNEMSEFKEIKVLKSSRKLLLGLMNTRKEFLKSNNGGIIFNSLIHHTKKTIENLIYANTNKDNLNIRIKFLNDSLSECNIVSFYIETSIDSKLLSPNKSVNPITELCDVRSQIERWKKNTENSINDKFVQGFIK